MLVRHARAMIGRFSLASSPYFGPECSPYLTGASLSLSTPDSPSPRPRFLARVTSTRPERPLHRTHVSGPVLTVEVLPVSSLDPHHQFQPTPAIPDPPPPVVVCSVSSDLAATDRSGTSHQALNLYTLDLILPSPIRRSRSLDTISRERALACAP
jgi:hypothetical protein